MYGKGRQGRRPTSLFVGLTPLSNLSVEKEGKNGKKMREKENRRKSKFRGRMRVYICFSDRLVSNFLQESIIQDLYKENE